MTLPSNRISIENPSDIQPFNNSNSNQKLSWLCYLCGVPAAQNSEKPTIEKKEKKNISKTLKTSQKSNFRKSINLETKILQNAQIDNGKKMSAQNGSELKSAISTLKGVEGKRFSMHTNQNLAQNKQMVNDIKFINRAIHGQQNMKMEFTNSITNFSQIQNLVHADSQPSIRQMKNMTQFGYPLVISPQNRQQTQDQKIKKSMTFSYGNQTPQRQVQKPNTHKIQTKSTNITESTQVGFERKVTLTSCKSYEIIQYNNQRKEQWDEKANKILNSPSKISTTQEIPPPFTQFRQVVSVNDPNDLNSQLNKEKSSNSNKAPKFLRNMKKKSSKISSAEMQKSIESDGSHNSYIQFGNKIRIGIRKAESINSKASDSDQYSEVLSHGQKSFLMAEINEVEEMSRVSSASGFRNWEDDNA